MEFKETRKKVYYYNYINKAKNYYKYITIRHDEAKNKNKKRKRKSRKKYTTTTVSFHYEINIFFPKKNPVNIF